ncbi:glycosyltransferase family 2 protein [Amphritea sp. 1_MG-2023]|uniref:glycosyltransferase family 2 protein n=1 Tax=Amphritea sp. 1_MG-2023 TaxID=3062670 RepID=UPI0026E159DD|nr:glycosyltransferase family 2 protein [Amphritea sp. 1_MG-2023]MDO6563772.1 glycosyltransferase family 2 protein [Amphritea sp. 1_MG-2023]
MPLCTVVMPVYNVENFVAYSIQSVLNQSCGDFELLIVDDCSPDDSLKICLCFDDPRIRIIRHSQNRGLAGARNSGIRQARGEYVAFIDSDDCWEADKLRLHAEHLTQNPAVGLSFSRSAFITADGQRTRCYQMPRLTDIDAGYLFCRNPIGNGSAPVLRKELLNQIAYTADSIEGLETCYFDPELRRSEDIECWVRIALTTSWKIEGIPQPMTLYRLNEGGLSASLYQQLASWEQVVEKTRAYAPTFIRDWHKIARAYQLRYLSRQAIRLRSGQAAVSLLHKALHNHWRITLQEPTRTLVTAGAAYLLNRLPSVYERLEKRANKVIGYLQQRRIQRDLRQRQYKPATARL